MARMAHTLLKNGGMSRDFDSTAILATVAHRPWPLPAQPYVMTQQWNDLLFMHWRVDAERLRPLIPAPFVLDLFEGQAWVAVVPFFMTNVAPRGVPAMPWFSEFAELNVRTYVRVGDRPGVFFFSLDAASAMAVRTARSMLNLPYYSATMQVTARATAIDYESRRTGSDPAAEFVATYEPTGPADTAAPGSLDYFLTERYCLYHHDHGGSPYRLEIHHGPWALQPARATVTRNTMAAASGIALPDEAPLLHFAKRQDVLAWAPSAVTSG
jgi:uncharacterized protein